MNELAERRKLLVMEADLHRAVIGLERANLQLRLAKLRAARERLATNKPLLLAGSAVGGLLALWKGRKFVSLIPAALSALKWARTLAKR